MRTKIDGKAINVEAISAPKQKREKWFHISKRMNASTKFLVVNKVISIVVSLLFCALLFNSFVPGGFFDFFVYSFNANATVNKLFGTLAVFAILLGISVALLPAFKMKYWNLGAEGQVLMGGLFAGIVSKFVGPYVPGALTILLMVLGAALGGAIWAVIPAIFRAFFKTNETLFTLMMNYLAMGIIACLNNFWDPEHGQFFSGLTHGMFAVPIKMTFLPYLITLIVVAIMAALVFVYLRFTKHGYELKVVGESENTAKYIGINIKKTIIRTLVFSGALAGLVGWLIVAGQTHILSQNTVAGRGFTGVMITWLGHFDVLEIIIMSFLVAFITRGSSQAATKGHIGDSFSKISVALFFFVILAFEFFATYEIHLNKENKKAVKVFGWTSKVKAFFTNLFKKKNVEQVEEKEEK